MNTTHKNEQSFPLVQHKTCGISLKNICTLFLIFSIASSFVANILSITFWVMPAEASPNQIKLLEFPLSTGNTSKTLTFPLYEQKGIQYFSAGLGKEERTLPYPPFSLKLIFVQGEGAYLARVSINLVNKDETYHIKIPREEVEGPWLFINVPNGTYVISGTDSNGTTIEKTITTETGETTVVYFPFP